MSTHSDAPDLAVASLRSDAAQDVPFRHRLILIVALTAITTAAVVQYSSRWGRLTIPPAYDDVGYMDDAATRMNILWQYGPLGLGSHFIHRPTHSPWSTLVAMTGFALFGVKDWAPYIMNALVVFGYLLVADYLLRRLSLLLKAICFIFLLCIPLVAESVYEFRPDHACSLITVAACMLLLERPLLTASRRRAVLTGLLFGAAMLTKPSTFPAIVILMIACLILSVAADCLGDRLRFRAGDFMRTGGVLLLVAAIVVAPYFWVNLGGIISYIRENFFGARNEEWKFKGTLSAILGYDVIGTGGKTMLGADIVVLAAILAAAGGLALLRRNRRELARMTAMALLLFGTYMMGVMNHMKSIFTGLTFQTCLVFMAIGALAYLFGRPESPGPRPRRLAAMVAVLAALFAMYHFAWPAPWGDYNGVMSTSRRQVADGIFDALVSHEVSGHGRVLVQGLGDINPALLDYMAAKHQRDFAFVDLPDTADLEPAFAEWDRADFVVASQQGTKITAEFLTRYRTLDTLLARLRQRRDFREIGFFPFALSGKGYYVFQKAVP